MISSISKLNWKPLLGAFFFILGCSSGNQKKSKDEAAIALTEDLNNLSVKVQTINYGPTLKQGGMFLDQTKELGLDGLQAVSFNAIDLNFDGKTDLVILPTYYSRPQFMIFDKVANKFMSWSHDPLPADFKASILTFHDFNKDRIPDLVTGVLNQRSEVSQVPVKLFYGEIRKGLLYFVEDTKAFKLSPEPTSSITLLDYDLDGWTDIFIANWFENKEGQYYPVHDRLFRNVKGKFTEVTSLLSGESVKSADQLYPPLAKPTYGASTCDIDQNGFPDIMTVSSSGHKNKLWMNLKETTTNERFFEDVGSVSNYASDPEGSLIPTGGGRTFFSSCTDYNDDGLMDIFLGELSHAYDNESVDKSSILTGSRDTYPPYFLRTEYVSDATSESWNQGDRRGVWMDYNLDGRVDLLVDNSGFPPYSRLVMFEQDETRAFINVGSQIGLDIVNPTGTISIDFNQDGLPDILTSQNNVRRAEIAPRLYAFINQTNRGLRKAIKVYLGGIKSNSQGLGAVVMLYTIKNSKKIVQKRYMELGQGGLASQNEEGLHFGMDEGQDLVGIKVRWPYLRKKGFSSGEVLEKMYSIKGLPDAPFLEITLCEDGKLMAGKLSCQL